MNTHHESNPKLTLIIPFLNEGEEVLNTIKSARSFVGNAVCIIAINDGSDDAYAYGYELAPFNITYVKNKIRMGVAATRDLGVSLCETPYFLLLDAHMRFYNKEWVETIISLLDLNDRQLLCCQTKVLWREEDGRITEPPADSDPTAFGAFQPLMKSNPLPDIHWNYEERNPGCDTEPIAAVLGAGYAASKRYWTYLRGLEGLKLYGSDEAFISWKVWLEGGQCTLLKRQVIGHLYRKTAPYPLFNDQIIYNNLFIATLLFPPVLRCWAYAIACTLDNFIFLKANDLIAENTTRIETLKEYFKEIFTVPFHQILDLHRFCQKSGYKALDVRKKSLLQIAQWLPIHEPESKGLMEGRAGLVIWFYQYARYCEEKPDNLVYQWLDEIEESVMDHLLPLNFHHGLCGIGWLYIYLHTHGFQRHSNDSILQEIDKEVQTVCLSAMADDSLDFGAGGIFCYVATRLRYAATIGRKAPLFSIEFRQHIQNAATGIIARATDLYACFYAFQCLDILQNGACQELWKPEIHEWMNYPDFLPEEETYWKSGLYNGCAGYSLLYLIIATKLNHNKTR